MHQHCLCKHCRELRTKEPMICPQGTYQLTSLRLSSLTLRQHCSSLYRQLEKSSHRVSLASVCWGLFLSTSSSMITQQVDEHLRCPELEWLCLISSCSSPALCSWELLAERVLSRPQRHHSILAEATNRRCADVNQYDSDTFDYFFPQPLPTAYNHWFFSCLFLCHT